MGKLTAGRRCTGAALQQMYAPATGANKGAALPRAGSYGGRGMLQGGCIESSSLYGLVIDGNIHTDSPASPSLPPSSPASTAPEPSGTAPAAAGAAAAGAPASARPTERTMSFTSRQSGLRSVPSVTAANAGGSRPAGGEVGREGWPPSCASAHRSHSCRFAAAARPRRPASRPDHHI